MGLYSIYQTTWADVTTFIYTKRFADSGAASGDSMTGSCTVYYLLDYVNAPLFVRQVMGSPGATDFSNPTTLVRRLPLQNPDWPAFYATTWDVTPVLHPSHRALNGECSFTYEREICYEYAWVGITYASLPYNPQVLFTKKVKSGSQSIPIPDYSYFFESSGNVVSEDSKVEIPLTNQLIELTYYQVPFFDDAAFVPLQNCVNSEPFGGYAAGSLLFSPMNSDYSSGVGSGSGLYTVTFTLCWRSKDWNMVLGSDGVWDFVNTQPDGSGLRLHEEVDFNGIL